MPVGLQITVTGDQAVIKTLGALSKNMRLALSRAILVEAHDLRALIVKGIRDQAPGGMKFKPISQITARLRMMQRKGSSNTLSRAIKGMRSGDAKVMAKSTAGLMKATSGMKALINSGSLIGSINVTKIGKDPLDGVFVGVHRSARRKKGQGGDPVSIAAVHEFGSKAYTVTVTKKMRGWWFAMYKAGVFSAPLKKMTTSITRKTPARPYIRPSVSVWKEKLEERLGRRIQMEIDKIIAESGAKGT
jgi:hypothetical protein